MSRVFGHDCRCGKTCSKEVKIWHIVESIVLDEMLDMAFTTINWMTRMLVIHRLLFRLDTDFEGSG